MTIDASKCPYYLAPKWLSDYPFTSGWIDRSNPPSLEYADAQAKAAGYVRCPWKGVEVYWTNVCWGVKHYCYCMSQYAYADGPRDPHKPPDPLTPWTYHSDAACWHRVSTWPYGDGVDPGKWPVERPGDWPGGWDFQPFPPPGWDAPPYLPVPIDWAVPVWPEGQPMELRATAVPGCRQWQPGRF